MRLLTVAGVTILLLMGAVPLAVPGVPRLSGIPQPVAAGVLGLAGVAFLAGVVFLVRGAWVRRRAEAVELRDEPAVPMAPGPMASVAPAPREAVVHAPRAGFVAVRTRL
jgi:hypothetical protein